MKSEDIPLEYLTFREAAEFLRWEEQTLRNRVAKGVLKRGVHYFKREGEIAVRFKRAALVAWLEGEEKQQQENIIPMAKGYALGRAVGS